MHRERLRKIALYLKYIAFVIDEELKKPRKKGELSQNERNRRISRGLRMMWKRRKQEASK